ncbi:MAG: hypothetical protein R6W48_07190 [Gaiellaceae bacterium]
MEDFRVEVELADDERAVSLQERLRAHVTDDEGGGRGVMVTRDGSHVFLYAETEAQARGVERMLGGLAGSRLESAAIRVTRWHPIEEAWKDASIPLPSTSDEEAAEVAARETAEEAEAEAEGDYDWHVLVRLPSRGAAVELEDALSAEGHAVKRRWRYVVVGVLTEERAEELAERLGAELAGDAEVRIEANLSDVQHSALQFLPF